MKYDEIRDQIETGDAILMRGSKGFMTPFTKFFTRSPYHHCGLAFWLGGELWVGEINGGRNHAIPLSQLAETPFDVFARPDGITSEQAGIAIHNALRAQIDYGYLALPVIGLLEFLRIRLFVHWKRILVCSGWCISTYIDAGWPDCSRVISPQRFSEMLRLKFTVN